MHTSAPAAGLTNAQYNALNEPDNTNTHYAAGNKVNAIENQYYAGDLVIKKEVTGNAGVKNDYFKVTVVFTKPAGTVVNSDIPFTAYLLDESKSKYTSTPITIKGQYYTGAEDTTILKWTTSDTSVATATAEFYVKDNDTVTFSNIPYGINYTVQEEKPADDTYKNTITFKDGTKDTTAKFDGQDLTADTDSAALSADFSKQAVGSISDPRDVITIENKKVTTIDIGVLLSNAPFFAMLGVAAAGLIALFRRKRRIEE